MTNVPPKRLIFAAEIESVKARIAIYEMRIPLFEKLAASVKECPKVRHHQHKLREEIEATVLMMPAMQGVQVPGREETPQRLLEEVADIVANLKEALGEAQVHLAELVARFEALP